MGMSSRDYTDIEIAEIARVAGKQPPYQRSDIERVVALDAVAIVVNKRNPIQSLALCDIAEVFAGRKAHWRDLGHQGPISVHISTESSGTQNALSGTFDTFRSLVLENCHAALANGVSLHSTYPELLNAVAADEGGIGFAPAVLVDNSVRAVHLRGGCGIEQAITSFNVKTEDYPLARRLYVFRPFGLSGYARQFENYIVADTRADDVVNAQSGAIDQKIETLGDHRADHHPSSIHASETAADARSHDAFDAMARRGYRLSISYRFAFGSGELDTKAKQDILRLAGYLQNTQPRPTVVLAGFADNIGSVGANVELATRRAEEVRRALPDIVPGFQRDVQARGFGKILPVNCNDSELGRAKNRRVEVYLMP